MSLIRRLLGKKSEEDYSKENAMLEKEIAKESVRAAKVSKLRLLQKKVQQRQEVLAKLKGIKQESGLVAGYRRVRSYTSPRIKAFEAKALPVAKKVFSNIGREFSGMNQQNISARPAKRRNKKSSRKKRTQQMARTQPVMNQRRVYDPWTGKWK